MKNSLTRKLLLAVITLGIAVIATVGSTYAWFSMNTTVEATGMQLTATTPVNVVISKERASGYANAITFDKLTENLYPASTDPATLLNSDGTFTFWAVQEGQVIGSNGEGGKAEQAGSNATRFQDTEYEADSQYVIAQKFYLKTTAGKVGITLDEITLGNAVTPSSGTVSSAVGDYDLADAVYVALLTQYGVYVYSVNGDDDGVIGIKDVISSSAGDFEYGTAFELSDSDTPVFGSTSDNKLGTTAEEVTVLVWVEGEDPDCVNGIGGLGLSIGLTFKYINETFEEE